ncbi:MAG: hypothetical protein J6L73_01160 [Muribaculaceae bacterium]|nr:hypothetical protein [Muribaculaceae bacterium]
MKKTFVLAVAALAVAGTLCLSSCKKSNADLIDEYKELCQEAVDAAKSGDAKKAEEIKEKGEKLQKELEGRDLTDEEKQEIITAALGAAGQMLK